MQIAASLPMTLNASNRITVPATVEGQPVRLMVDTGAPMTLLQRSKAEALGLKYEMAKRWERGRFFGGTKVSRKVTVNEFILGNLKASGVEVWLAPDEHQLEGADGLLGASVLLNYDVDFDFAGAKLNLFLPHRCPGKVVYWTQNEDAITKIPMTMDHAHVRLDLAIDGVPIKATLDTGASGLTLDMETFMPKFGLTPQSPGVVAVPARDGVHTIYRYTAKNLSFGGVNVTNPIITFVPQDLSKDRDYDMLLGMDVLRHLHMFFAYKEKMLYVTSATQH